MLAKTSEFVTEIPLHNATLWCNYEGGCLEIVLRENDVRIPTIAFFVPERAELNRLIDRLRAVERFWAVDEGA